MNDLVIQTDGLTKRYGDILAVVALVYLGVVLHRRSMG